jgi:hypothetical protein
VHTLRTLSLGFWNVRLMHNDVGVAIGLVQYTLPLMVMILFGVIQNVPPSLEDARRPRRLDWRAFRRVLLPLLWPGTLAAALIAFNMNMGAFTSAVLLGRRRVLTVPIMIQRKIILETDYPNAAALALLLTLTVVAVNLAALKARPAAIAGTSRLSRHAPIRNTRICLRRRYVRIRISARPARDRRRRVLRRQRERVLPLSAGASVVALVPRAAGEVMARSRAELRDSVRGRHGVDADRRARRRRHRERVAPREPTARDLFPPGRCRCRSS